MWYTWVGMYSRCYYKSDYSYKHYGGRGIIVCERWKNSFKSFSQDMRKGYKKGLSIDRINVNGNYEPSNCRWATMKEQRANCRTSLYVTYKGETKIAAAWAADLGMTNAGFLYRLKKWDINKAMNHYIKNSGNYKHKKRKPCQLA